MEAICSGARIWHYLIVDKLSGSNKLREKWAVGNIWRVRESASRKAFFHLRPRDRGYWRGRHHVWDVITFRPLTARGTVFMNSFNEDDDGNASDIALPPGLDEILNYVDGERHGQGVLTRHQPRTSNGNYNSDGMGLQEGYVGVFVRLLGLDNPVEDREEAVRALWRHSMAGKEFIDQIVQFPGCLNLIVSLLPSDRPASSEAAAGLLRNIASVNTYRSAVTEAGALEEITGLLTRRSISSELREKATCVLWNLSVEEDPRKKLVEPEILQALFKMLDSEIVGEQEAAAGVISNLTLSPENHEILVDAGIIPKFARILLSDSEASKISRREVRNALVELSKDSNSKLLIIEEGLIPVPLIGASAYRSFKPLLQVAAELPDTVKIKQPMTKVESKFGAGELLLGLNSESADIDDATRLIIEGRVRQQFLARIGLLGKNPAKSDWIRDAKITLLPWWDGIPRLILILGLDHLEGARQAALAIAEISINEETRQAVHKAGAVPHLVRLLGSGDEHATAAAAFALDKLAVSSQVRKSINAHDAPSALVAILKAENAPEFVKEKVVGALFRLSQSKKVEANAPGSLSQSKKFEANAPGSAIPGLLDIVHSENASLDAKEEAEEILEELSNLNADPRDKIIAAGGLHPLIQIMLTGPPGQAEKAICVLENLAKDDANLAAILDAGTHSALMFLLDVDVQVHSVHLGNGKTLSKADSYMLIGAALRLLDKLASSEKVKTSVFSPLLSNIIQSDVPQIVKDWVSACLLKLEQCDRSP